jgi:transcriptional regulator with XRE-family HTH domain
MSRSASIISTLPKPAAEELRKVGLAVRAARLARNEPQASLARRLGISLNTLRAIELGDPRVGSGALISALWALGLGPIGEFLANQAAKSAPLAGKKRARGAPSKALDDF